jgi:hypothetical protein
MGAPDQTHLEFFSKKKKSVCFAGVLLHPNMFHIDFHLVTKSRDYPPLATLPVVHL